MPSALMYPAALNAYFSPSLAPPPLTHIQPATKQSAQITWRPSRLLCHYQALVLVSAQLPCCNAHPR